MAHCGWEGRDVITALSEWRIAGREIEHLGSAEVAGLDVHLQVRGGSAEAAERELLEVMRAKHSALAEAGRIERGGEGTLSVRFQAQASPQRRQVADQHSVACYLYE